MLRMTLRAGALLAAGALILTGCSSTTPEPAAPTASAEAEAPPQTEAPAATEGPTWLEPNSTHAGTHEDPVPIGETFKHPDYPWIVTMNSSDLDDAEYIVRDEIGFEQLGLDATLGFAVSDIPASMIQEDANQAVDAGFAVSWEWVSGQEVVNGTPHGEEPGTDAGGGAIYDFTTYHSGGCETERLWSSLMWFTLLDENGQPKPHTHYQETAQECVKDVPPEEVPNGLWRATFWNGEYETIDGYESPTGTHWVYFHSS